MKKVGIINQPIAAVVGGLGHTDMITIADAGLPIPAAAQRIDLALTRGIPSFLETLQVVLSELFVEKAIVAEELKSVSPKMYETLVEVLGKTPIEFMPHEDFKRETAVSRAIIRTGEFTPYANVILVTGAWGFDLDD
ncbi:MAG: D-ribose pyranase [Chloroflexi bacterium]|nr:MAG: D-ribose pyranase [Chloroflexota bacterium]